MNEKEMNQAILAELKRIANEVFAKVKVSKEGTYTAAELWNGKNSMGEKIEIFYMGTESDVYTAKVDTFEFHVSAQDVFLRLWKFEQLCKVRQEAKERFTYGEAEHEIVNEKAMYYTGMMERCNYDEKLGYSPVIGDGNYKVVTRKTTLKKLSDKLAVDKKERPYYKAGGTWYLINDRELSEKTIERIKNEPDYIFGILSKWDYSVKCELNAIFKALFEALKSERVNSAPEQRKSENEAEKAVICDIVAGRTSSGLLCVEQMRLKSIGNSLYKDDKNLYFLYDSFCYCLGGYTRGVATFLKEQGNNIQGKIREMIEQGGISTDSAKILYGEMRKDDMPVNSGSVQETNEDYPPEPYNEANTDDTGQKIEKCESSCDNQEKKCIVEHVSDIQGKNMRPNYLRQKVFTTELFYARRKISRFKPRYLIGYTNYHLCKENALERKGNGNTSVYKVLIRGET